jgi:hypothetical protein
VHKPHHRLSNNQSKIKVFTSEKVQSQRNAFEKGATRKPSLSSTINEGWNKGFHPGLRHSAQRALPRVTMCCVAASTYQGTAEVPIAWLTIVLCMVFEVDIATQLNNIYKTSSDMPS